MRIAIIGYGRMGHEIEAIAKERGHEITLIVDHNNIHELGKESLAKVDVAIEFTTPETAFENIKKCLEANTPIVCGTTGWLNNLDKAKELMVKHNGTLFCATNYSIGVNLFFSVNRLLAKYIDTVKGYEVTMEEVHHTQKKDAPSGTAITLAEIISHEIEQIKGWTLDPETKLNHIPITAIREEAVPGTHTVCYSSSCDEITLTHRAKNRKGFALGAVLAAEYSFGKKGFLTMNELLSL